MLTETLPNGSEVTIDIERTEGAGAIMQIDHIDVELKEPGDGKKGGEEATSNADADPVTEQPAGNNETPSRTASHLNSYPVVASVKGLVGQLPVVQILSAHAESVFAEIAEQYNAGGIVEQADKLGDQVLDGVDAAAPRARDAVRSARRRFRSTAVASSIGAATLANVLRPTGAQLVNLLNQTLTRNNVSSISVAQSPIIRYFRNGEQISLPDAPQLPKREINNAVSRKHHRKSRTSKRRKSRNSTKEIPNSRLNRTRNVVYSARSQRALVYGNGRRPIVRGVLDSLLRPANNYAIEVVGDYLPEGKPLVNKPATNELTKSFRLGETVVRRAFRTVRDSLTIPYLLPRVSVTSILGNESEFRSSAVKESRNHNHIVPTPPANPPVVTPVPGSGNNDENATPQEGKSHEKVHYEEIVVNLWSPGSFYRADQLVIPFQFKTRSDTNAIVQKRRFNASSSKVKGPSTGTMSSRVFTVGKIQQRSTGVIPFHIINPTVTAEIHEGHSF